MGGQQNQQTPLNPIFYATPDDIITEGGRSSIRTTKPDDQIESVSAFGIET